jgi:hypothetical protein
MDKGKDRVTESETGEKTDPEQRADELEQKAEAIRDNLDGLVAELDYRRHEAVRRWAKPIAIGAAVLGAGVVALIVWRRSRRRPSRLERFRAAIGRAMAHPDRVAKTTPSMGKKIAAAAGMAGVSVAARRLVSRVLPDR